MVRKTEEIWLEYKNRVLGFIKDRVPKDVSEDILQDVFLKILINIGSLREDAKVESWIYGIVRNTIADYYRKKQSSSLHMEKVRGEIRISEKNETDEMREELSSCLIPMINELPEEYRRAVFLSEIEGKTQKEVADMEGLSLSGAKSRVQRGREFLKEMLHDCCRIELDHKNRLVSCEKKDSGCNFC